MVSDLVQRIREFRPQVLLTFDPAGGVTAHTDHSMASIFATLAFHWAGRTNRFPDQLSGIITPWTKYRKLYFATADFTLPGRQPVTLAPATTVIEVGDYLETKIDAFRAHISQQPLWPMFEEYSRKRGVARIVSPGRGGEHDSCLQEKDLFAALKTKTLVGFGANLSAFLAPCG